ncbi:MAG: VOC family protein [Solirubrobacterales bacterium]
MGTELEPIDPSLRIGSARLAVADLSRSVDFYERVLGLALVSRDDDGARLGADRDRPELVLAQLSHATPASPRNTGLFHLAWLHPSRGELAATVQRVAGARWPIHGASDHGVSEALYLTDPDGLGVEIYADRPRERWERPAGGHGVKMVTLPLDLEDLMAQAPADPAPAMAADARLGHVHLKVSDVPRAAAFYHDAIGLQEQARLPSAAFLSAGRYHHHVGLNSWQSRGASAPSDSEPGLRLLEFELGASDALAALERRLAGVLEGGPSARRESEGLYVSDPDCHRLAFITRSRRAERRSSA